LKHRPVIDHPDFFWWYLSLRDDSLCLAIRSLKRHREFEKHHSQINSNEEGIQKRAFPPPIVKLGAWKNDANNDLEGSVMGDGDSRTALFGRNLWFGKERFEGWAKSGEGHALRGSGSANLKGGAISESEGAEFPGVLDHFWDRMFDDIVAWQKP
jgi:hypothetical protein